MRELLLVPTINHLCSQIRDLCTSDCRRIITDLSVLSNEEISTYWERLKPKTANQGTEQALRILTVEETTKPCKIGFNVDKNRHCPLLKDIKDLKSLAPMLASLQHAIRFRADEKLGTPRV